MPKIKVGGTPVKVTWAEFHICLIPKGTAVEFTKHRGEPSKAIGIFEGSMFYDGVVGHVLVGNEIVHLHPEFGDRVRKLRDCRQAPFVGENI